MKIENIFAVGLIGLGLVWVLRKVGSSAAGLEFRIFALKYLDRQRNLFVVQVFNPSRVPVPAVGAELRGNITIGNLLVGEAIGTINQVIPAGGYGFAELEILFNADSWQMVAAMIGLDIANRRGVSVGFLGTVTISGVSFPLDIKNVI